MSFFAILFALLIEQVRPLGRGNPIHALVRAWFRGVARNFDAGQPHHAWLVWSLAVLVPAMAAMVLHWLLVVHAGWPFAVLWNVAVLYATLGFRQFSHHFTGLRDALEAGDEERARQILAEWQQVDARELPRREIIRHVIEFAVIAAHRHVFGVLAWYSVGAAFGLGPAGAVLFRCAEFGRRYWQFKAAHSVHPGSQGLQRASQRAWQVVDWVPARLTALGFAVVGSFEDAIDSWRQHAERFPEDSDGVILAATSGAINVRLGGDALRALPVAGTWSGGDEESQPGVARTPGREPEVAHLAQVVGLVWRTVVMWMLLLALLTLARLLG